MDDEVNALATSKYIATLADEDDIKDLSPLKLQKLLYFIEGGLLADENVTEFYPEVPEAWPYGPVYVDVYEKFKDKANREPIIVSDFDDGIGTEFCTPTQERIRATWDTLKNKSASELVTLSHRTKPWIIAKDFGYGSRISKEDMREYFTAQAHEPRTIE